MHVEVPEIHTGQEEVFPVSANRFRGRIVRADENDRCEWSDAEGNAHLEGRLTEAGRRDGGRPPAKRRRPRDSSRRRVIDVQLEGPWGWVVDSSHPVSVQAREDCNGLLSCGTGSASISDSQSDLESTGALVRVFGILSSGRLEIAKIPAPGDDSSCTDQACICRVIGELNLGP